MWLARLDAKGTFLWLQLLDPNEETPASPLGLAQLADGGFLVAGATLYYYADEAPIHLISTDADGNVLWIRADKGKDLAVQSACPSNDGGIVVTAQPYLYSCNGPAVLLMKFDAKGERVWSAAWDDCSSSHSHAVMMAPAAQWVADAVTALPGGGYAVAGTGQDSSVNAFVAAFDENGSPTWSDTWDDGTYASAAAATPDGGLVVAGALDEMPWVFKLGP
jgi:hypothetical protein